MFPEHIFEYSPVLTYRDFLAALAHNKEVPMYIDGIIDKIPDGEYYNLGNLEKLMLGEKHKVSNYRNLTDILGIYAVVGTFAIRRTSEGLHRMKHISRSRLKSTMVKHNKRPIEYIKQPLELLRNIIDKDTDELQAIVDRGVYDVS